MRTSNSCQGLMLKYPIESYLMLPKNIWVKKQSSLLTPRHQSQ